MSPILRWAARNPVRALAACSAVLTALAPFIPQAATTAVLGVLSAALGVGVHSVVTPAAKAAENAAQAAVSAATEVARQLDGTTAGLEGAVTVAAEQVVDHAVGAALDAIK